MMMVMMMFRYPDVRDVVVVVVVDWTVKIPSKYYYLSSSYHSKY